MEVSVWLQLDRCTRGESCAGTHHVGGLVGLDMDALEKRKIMSIFLKKIRRFIVIVYK
jgi:hypothetical protein